jgi:hypothetical protein
MFFSCGKSYRFVVVLSILTICISADIKSCDAAFEIQQDAFAISNSPGYCFAMAAFSRWYYLMHQGEPPLRRVLDQRAQQVIAKELQSFYSKNLISLQAEYCNKYHGNQSDSFKSFLEGLIKGEPRIILLMNKGPKGAILHAVLGYEFCPTKNVIKIYDPNYTNEERVLDIDKGEYVSLDINYNAICFPEVLHHNDALVKKMESLYAFHVERKQPAPELDWRRAAAGPSKPERYPKSPTR